MNPAPFCRDCLGFARDGATRCPLCASPRLLAHVERDSLAIAHVDCDAFYAAVEKRDNPSLRDKPVIVGGSRRGVVSTCCYIARTYGVRSAMPMFKALQACPQAVVIKPDMKKYAGVGREIRQMMLALTPLVEPISIDEAFLDLSGTEQLHRASPAYTLARMAVRVEKEIGISVSIGLSYCKFLAKVASDLDKPRGYAVLGRGEAVDFLKIQKVGLIWGVGKVAQERLARDGLLTIGDIQNRAPADLARRYGDEGVRLARLARGDDTRKVTPEHETRSVSSETTFNADMGDAESLMPILLRLSERVSARLKKAGLCGRSITLKLKTGDFKLRTRSRSGLPATQLSTRIFDVARELLKPELGPARFRLMGVGVSDLLPGLEADRGDLVDTGLAREKATEKAIDALRAKFGDGAVVRGLAFGDGGRRKDR